jgi:amidophosphoribosyltransferase
VIIDDSLVRGTTSQKLVGLVREAGAKSIHVRISSPPVTGPCFFGIDTPRRSELLAAQHSIEEMCKFIGADTLKFLTVEGMRNAVSGVSGANGLCDACFTGDYPMKDHCRF